ncbi:MAG: DUF502 domain-containing protein [bacterium]|nr:DUF502 domain-containing protein [bacterium]
MEVFRKIKNAFIYGIVIILPVFVTFKVLQIVIKMFIGFSMPIVFVFIKNRFLAEVFSFIISLVIIVIVGVLAKKLFGGKLKEYISEFLKGIPVISTIYKAADDVVNFFFSSKANLIRGSIVAVKFPHKDITMLGFVTGKSDFLGEDRLLVFVPTTPNPTSGFLIAVKSEDVKYLDISVEDAFKMILSGGLSKATR